MNYISIIEKFESLKNSNFVGIHNYTNTKGQISNLVINTNISVQNAKLKDLDVLKTISENDLLNLSNQNNLSLNLLNSALITLIGSAERNLTYETRNNYSIGQSNAYYNITKGIKIHKESLKLYITGFKISQTIIKAGETIKIPNSNMLTIAKNIILNSVNLKMKNFYNITIENSKEIRINKNIIIL
jgi:hypothetical protein